MESSPLESALLAAEAAAAVHRQAFRRGLARDVVRKGRADFVTEVDLAAQEAALAVLRARHPTHRILAEEDDDRGSPTEAGGTANAVRTNDSGTSSERGAPQGGGAALSAGPIWIVDPLDGTTNFLHGHPMHAASVGFWVDDIPTAGAVVASATDDRWWAERGKGAFRNGRRIAVSGTRALDEALVGTGFPFKHPERLPVYLKEFARVLGGTAGIRRGGSAALDLCFLADGIFDAFWEGILAPWDVAAGVVLVQEAGGIVMRPDGTRIRAGESGPVVAANGPELLASLRDLLDGDGGSGAPELAPES